MENKTEKISSCVVLVSLFIYATFASTSIAFSQGAILLGLLGWLCYCIATKKWEWPSSPLGMPLLVFFFFSIVSSLLGLNVLYSLDSLRAYTFMLLIFLIPAMVPQRFLRPLMWCFILLAGAGGAIYFTAGHLLRGEIWHIFTMQELHRSGPLFAAAAALAACEDNWLRKAVLFVAACLLLFVLTTGLERTYWLATIAGLLVVALMRSKKVLILLVIGLCVAAAFPQIRGRVAHTVEDMRKGEAYSRFQMWALAPEIMSQYPYGIGPENDNDILEMKLGWDSSHFHNNFVNIAVDLGFLGLVAWCWWMMAFTKLAYDTWHDLLPQQGFEKGVCLAGLAAMTVFLVAGLFSFNFGDGDTETDMIMYFLMGCVLAVRRDLPSRDSQDSKARPEMRILHVEKQMKLSGQSLRTLKEIRGLIESGHRVTLACQPDSVVGHHAAKLGASLITLPMSGIRLYTSALRLRKHVLREEYDSINAHGARSHLLAVLALLGTSQIPVIRTKHNTVPFHSGVFSRMLYTRYTKLAVAISDAVRVGLVDQGVPEDKIRLIYTGVDIHRFRPRPKDAHLMERLGLSQDHFVIGSSGRLGSPSFNCETIIRAFQELAPRYRDLRLLLIGRGAERVIEMIEELGLTDRVILPGFTDDMPTMLSLIDLHVQPNSMAALSTAMLESMAMGKPTLATGIGGHPEVVVDGETGRLCPPGNPQAMAEVIVEMIEDKDKLSEMGRMARKRVESLFDVDQMTKELERMYVGLIGEGQ